MVNQVTKPEVSEEEQNHRNKLYPDVSTVLNKNPLCTSCNSSVKSEIISNKTLLHPFLETLLCHKCHSFYGDGDFSVDEDGSDKYCRWCGQGGTLYLCSSCTGGFCKKCIKRNLPRSVLKDVESNNWDCFCCDVKPLFDLRAMSWAAVKHVESLQEKKKVVPQYLSDSDYNSDYRRSNKRHRKTKKQELSFEEKAYKKALSKENHFLNEILIFCDNVKKKTEEIKLKTFNRRATASVTAEMVEVTEKKIRNVFNLLNQFTQNMNNKLDNFLPEWKETLETAKEKDKTTKESEHLENGDPKKKSKKSILKNSNRESEEETGAKRKSRIKKDEDSDEASEEETSSKPKSKKLAKYSDEETRTPLLSTAESKKTGNKKIDSKKATFEPKSKTKSRKSTNDSDGSEEKPQQDRKKQRTYSEEESGEDFKSKAESSDDNSGDDMPKSKNSSVDPGDKVSSSRMSKGSRFSLRASDNEAGPSKPKRSMSLKKSVY